MNEQPAVVLMILTSHRLDCLRLCMDCLFASRALPRLRRVVFLLNGVRGRQLAYVRRTVQEHPEVRWDTISGPRGRGRLISGLQNECVRRYPGTIYIKLDEDTFVCRDWLDRMLAAYAARAADPDLALITPVIPNSGLGLYHLLDVLPDLAAEYQDRFRFPRTDAFDAPVWKYPRVAEWAIRRTIDMEQTNRRLRQVVSEPYREFAARFNINCILYDYRHWREIGGVPEHDEIGWGEWTPAHGKHHVVIRDTVVQHYSFFVQQDWLDRSTLLEDLRRANLPQTLARPGLVSYHLPRGIRIARQVPRIIRRRLLPES
ncbi:MAG TPA: hypothetical protein EYP62_01185 [Kiritimatiellae bacterium]|nr:hypothetical protein [Kiritimatiellia bacterium]